ncbi:unnamed protein product [Rotaria sp. Silwood1]|nr:unnamed protein product [Rotaria sp. Silwood1]
MKKMTPLEDLSNELFFEIFDYLHALDIFMAFSTLNQRITLIRQLCEEKKQYTSQTILIYQSSSLRSLDFVFYFYHSHLTTGVTLKWTLTPMTLTFYGLSYQVSIYCVLYVFHIYRALRRLRVFILILANPNIQHA